MNKISKSDKLLVSVSQGAVTQAEQAIEACQLCTFDAAVPFSGMVLSFRGYNADQVELILPVLAHCPRCGSAVNESTLIKPKRQRGRKIPILTNARQIDRAKSHHKYDLLRVVGRIFRLLP